MRRNRVPTRQMPADESIHWKPMRDAHYVLASLQPADGGRRKIFVRQQALARVEALARAVRGRRIVGLLLGHFYRCPTTGLDFEVIESLAEHPHALADENLAEAVEQALAAAGQDALVLGWYCSVSAVETKLAGSTAAIHGSCFPEPWQVTLAVSDGASTPGGAFFLYDKAATRWFYAPFYELPDHAPKGQQAKPTCISWPQYMTVDDVVSIRRDQRDESEGGATVDPDRSASDRTVTTRSPASSGHVHRMLSVERPAPASRSVTSDSGRPAAPTDPGPARARDTIVEAAPERAADEVRGIPVERAADRIRRIRPKNAPAVDHREPKRGAPRGGVQLIGDADDTAMSDEPGRFIELARSEGFFVAAKFDSAADERPVMLSGTREAANGAETLWVLNDPYAGILLTVVSTDTQVLDASLHYNLHTDEAGLLRTPFPEHRDLASQTIYVRETCVDQLRAKCRRIRASNALEREWKVSPTIYLLTPGEWESADTNHDDPRTDAVAIQTLNRQRIGVLPEAVRNQFRLSESPHQTG